MQTKDKAEALKAMAAEAAERMCPDDATVPQNETQDLAKKLANSMNAHSRKLIAKGYIAGYNAANEGAEMREAWISISERMPHYGQKVQVWPAYGTTIGQDYMVDVRHVYNDGSGGTYFEFDEHKMITHWAPLLKPPHALTDRQVNL